MSVVLSSTSFVGKVAFSTLLPLLVFLSIKVCTKTIKNNLKNRRLLAKVEKRLKEREDSIEKVRQYAFTLSTERANYITSLSFLLLREELQLRKITCSEALRAYQQKALRSQESTNCVCLFIQEAIEQAEYFDNLSENSSSKLPYLFGIPISVKECIKLNGYDCTSGFAQDLFKPSNETDLLLHATAGAIPFVITNIPQSLCSFGCSNPIYGKTTHPLDSSRVPGGSSGIGTDIGGSIRIPATFCGLVGFKPSTYRMPQTRNMGTVPGRTLVLANAGPIARDVDTCIEFCQAIWDCPALYSSDDYLAPVGFQKNLLYSKEPLRIGYYVTDNYIKAVPAYERAVRMCVKILESLGHECIAFDVPASQKFFPLVAANISADGGVFLNNKLDEDLYDPDCDFGFVARKLSPFLKQVLSYLVPFPKLSELLRSVPRTAGDMRKITEETKVYRRDFLEKMKSENISVIISPVMSVYPPKHHVAPQIMQACNYTALYNLLDFAAGTVPVTTVTEEDERELQNYRASDPIERLIKQQSENSIGMPIGVQVAAPPYKEEVALRVLQILFENNNAKPDSVKRFLQQCN
ncbi:unnamed protein product [Auanema sp. JU1783]|nr:unnamed protein product [Auanema sp. JU1783]